MHPVTPIVAIEREHIFDENFKDFLFLSRDILDIIRWCELVKRNICHLFYPTRYSPLLGKTNSFFSIPLLRDTGTIVKNISLNKNSFICNPCDENYPLEQLLISKEVRIFNKRVLSFKSNTKKHALGTITLLNFEIELESKTKSPIDPESISKFGDIFLNYASRHINPDLICNSKRLELSSDVEFSKDNMSLKLKNELLLVVDTEVDFCDQMLITTEFKDKLDILPPDEKITYSLEKMKKEVIEAKKKNNVILRGIL